MDRGKSEAWTRKPLSNHSQSGNSLALLPLVFPHSMNSTFLIQLKLPVPYLSFHVLITGTNVMEVKAGHQCAINSSLQAWRFRVFTFNIRCD